MPKIAALIACGTDGQKAIVDGLLCYITEMIYSLQRKYRGLFEEMRVYCRKEAPIFGTDIQQTGNYIIVFFFLSGFSFTDTDKLQDSIRRFGTIFHFTLPVSPAHKHSGFYLQFACEMIVTHF